MAEDLVAQAVSRLRIHLTDAPQRGLGTDSFAAAVLAGGLRTAVTGPAGQTATTDMPRGIGGQASAPTPGWYMRAGIASCTATVIALRAAELGVGLDHLAVKVTSRSDDCGMFGIGNAPAGPLSASMEVEIRSAAAQPAVLEELVRWGIAHSPMADALTRAVPLEVTVRAAQS